MNVSKLSVSNSVIYWCCTSDNTVLCLPFIQLSIDFRSNSIFTVHRFHESKIHFTSIKQSEFIMLDAKEIVIISLLLFAGIIKCDINASKQGQLIFAHVIFRHGDRTPVDPYPTDPWKDRIYWPEGYGQLTNIGKEQHYQLGTYFRKRFQSLIGNGTYLRDIVYVQSTDVDRTLMSAESNLAGFFPPDGNQVWNNQIRWQPIPIHTVPEALDSVLAAKKPCPRYNYAMKKFEKSPEFKALLAKYKPLFQYLEENSGAPIKNFDQAQYLYNTLYIESLKNYTLPEWTKKVFVPGGDLEYVANRTFQMATYTPELARLKSGFLIREILDRFTQKIGSTLSPDRSIWIYSAHDTTVANILNALNLFEPHSPPYTASVLFELYKSSEGYYIQLFYKNSTNENLLPLNIPSCGTKCTIEQFRKVYEAVIPTGEYEQECKLSMLSMTYEEVDFRGIDGNWIALVCLSLTGLVIILLSWRVFKQERNMRWYHRL